MTLQAYMKSMSVVITPLIDEEDCYLAEVRGISPDGEMVILDLEIAGCTTKSMVLETLQAELEDLFDLRYNYSSEENIDDALLYDGGEFK